MRMSKIALVLCGVAPGLVACGDGGVTGPGMLVEEEQPANQEDEDENFDAGAEAPEDLDSGSDNGSADAGPKDAGMNTDPEDAGTTPPPSTTLTYLKNIQPIFEAKCHDCHGDDFGADKSFVSDYALAYANRVAIRSATLSKYMPYKCEDQECGLSDTQIAQISEWVLGGAPRGTP